MNRDRPTFRSPLRSKPVALANTIGPGFADNGLLIHTTDFEHCQGQGGEVDLMSCSKIGWTFTSGQCQARPLSATSPYPFWT